MIYIHLPHFGVSGAILLFAVGRSTVSMMWVVDKWQTLALLSALHNFSERLSFGLVQIHNIVCTT